MGVNGCGCKCKDIKNEKEMDFGTNNKKNVNIIINEFYDNEKNQNNEFLEKKQNLMELFNKNGKSEYSKEITYKTNDGNNLDIENNKNKKKIRTFSMDNGKINIINSINKNNENNNFNHHSKFDSLNLNHDLFNKDNKRNNKKRNSKTHRKSVDMNYQRNKLLIIDDTQSKNSKLSYLNPNSKLDLKRNYLDDPIFNNKTCKDYFSKNHIYPVNSNSINIYSFIELNNPLIDKKDETLFFSEISRVQISGKKIINKTFIKRYCSSTKREFRIFTSKDKFLSLQKPIQIFTYKEMIKSCFIDFESEKNDKNNFESDSSDNKEPICFIIYLKKERFEMFACDKIEFAEKWVSLFNYLILKQNEYDKDDNQL